jgi:hypothetical protein
MGTPEEIIAAQDAWRDAKRGLRRRSRAVCRGSCPQIARPGPVDGLTREACERLTRLGQAEQAAAFCAVVDKEK